MNTIDKILEKLEAKRKGAWDAEVDNKALGFQEQGEYCQTRKEVFEEVIRMIKGKL